MHAVSSQSYDIFTTSVHISLCQSDAGISSDHIVANLVTIHEQVYHVCVILYYER
jgi:hypothetical protein